MSNKRFLPVAVLALALLAQTSRAHPEIGVGRTATNQLVPHMHFEQPARLPRSLFPGYPGFATALIGFESVPLDEPDEDLFTLSAASNISVRLTAADPGALIYDGFPVVAVGESIAFGPLPFDNHPIFNIPAPETAPGTIFTFRFVLRDASGLYTDSAEFSLQVTPACPADHNLSGHVSVQDIFDFLAAYFANFPDADFNRTGGVSTQDLFDFLAAYFTPCP